MDASGNVYVTGLSEAWLRRPARRPERRRQGGQSELNTVLSNYWPTCPWLFLTNTAGLGGTNVQFALTNATGWDFTVLMSTNLADWEALTNPASPVWQFADPAAPGQPQRYYRLRWP